MWAAVILGKTMSRQRFNLNLSQHQFCFLFFFSSTQRLVWPFTLNLSQHNLFLFFFSSTQGWVWPFWSSASSPSWPISSFLASYSQIQSYCIRWGAHNLSGSPKKSQIGQNSHPHRYHSKVIHCSVAAKQSFHDFNLCQRRFHGHLLARLQPARRLF